MINLENNNNIEEIIRQKFNDFAPIPPKHIWERVENGINPKHKYFNTRNISIASVIIAAFLVIGYFGFMPSEIQNTVNNNPISSIDVINNKEIDLRKNADNNENQSTNKLTSYNQIQDNVINENTDNVINNTEIINVVETNIINKTNNQYNNYENNNFPTKISRKIIEINSINSHENDFMFKIINKPVINTIEESSGLTETLLLPGLESVSVGLRWKNSVFISPEVSFANIDSVEVLNTYSINVEPSLYFNDHWFIRSGVGLSFARDRGYARINYVTNECVGTYEDVYDVTFDTTSGEVIPIYHTKVVEVWDTVKHISVSGIVNKYMFLQVPVLLGYQWKHNKIPLSFYVFAGPAFNFKVSEWVADPKPPEDDAGIISMENTLPIRSNFYIQVWTGVGLEYKLRNNLSLAVEPGFRYYTNSIYKNSDILPVTTGFTLRAGIVYMF